MRTKRALPLLLSLCAVLCLGAADTAYAQQSYPPSEAVTYHSVLEQTYTLRAFRGRRVVYALPDSWLEGGGAQGLTPAEVVSLIERTDALYDLMADTLGAEPRERAVNTLVPGLTAVGVVPLPEGEGGARGVAYSGVKGFDISTDLRADVKAALAEGRLVSTIVHEMAHNFDLYRAHMGYYLDSSHLWTEFWIEYAAYLQRTGSYRVAPDHALTATLLKFMHRYDALATTETWSRCVKDGSVCEAEGIYANRVSAGILLRYVRLHGRHSLRGVVEFYRRYEATADPVTGPFLSDEQKNDLLAEALSEGAGFDVSTELDVWYWPVGAATREKLRARYPQANPFTQDADGDGWSRARGDLDDRDPTVNPGAAETTNGRDDDCNGFVDDVVRPAGGSVFTPPAKLVGRLRPTQSETYRFEGAGEFVVRTRTTGGGWGGLVEIRGEGEAMPLRLLGFTSTTINVYDVRLESRGPWTLRVLYSQETGPEGNYEVIIVPAQRGAEGIGNVLALPQRAPGSGRERALVPGGMARAIGTLPGASIAAADARPDAQGRWPTSLSGVEVSVAGQPATIIVVRPAGADTYVVDFVTPEQVTPAAFGPRAPILVRHAPSGAQWRLEGAELLESAPALWGRQADGQNTPAALALASPTFMAFDEASPAPATSETRVIVFASGLGVGRTAANTRLVAQLPDGGRVTLPVEHVGPTSLPGLHQIVLKLDPALAGQTRVLLSVEGGDDVRVALHLR
jgi:uncharacterized protein (TIGR03437 family)